MNTSRSTHYYAEKTTQYDAEVIDELLKVIGNMDTEDRARVTFLHYVRKLFNLYLDAGLMGVSPRDEASERFLTSRLNDLLKKGLVSKGYAESLYKQYLDPNVIQKEVDEFWSHLGEDRQVSA
jgi:hypothetical protein